MNTNDKVKIIGKKNIYRGFCQLDAYQLQIKKYDGSWSRSFERELLQRDNAVAVLLCDPKRRQVVLIEQFRIGALYHLNPWMIEVVAGLIKPGEKTIAVACRETQEETGLIITQLQPVLRYWSTPGASSEQLTLCYGIVDASQAGGIHGLSEEGEDIKVIVYDYDQAFRQVKSGRICNATAIIALQWLELNQDQLDSK